MSIDHTNTNQQSHKQRRVANGATHGKPVDEQLRIVRELEAKAIAKYVRGLRYCPCGCGALLNADTRLVMRHLADKIEGMGHHEMVAT
jgi:hypothetical protein